LPVLKVRDILTFIYFVLIRYKKKVLSDFFTINGDSLGIRTLDPLIKSQQVIDQIIKNS